jgi:hypothetical protein
MMFFGTSGCSKISGTLYKCKWDVFLNFAFLNWWLTLFSCIKLSLFIFFTVRFYCPFNLLEMVSLRHTAIYRKGRQKIMDVRAFHQRHTFLVRILFDSNSFKQLIDVFRLKYRVHHHDEWFIAWCSAHYLFLHNLECAWFKDSRVVRDSSASCLFETHRADRIPRFPKLSFILGRWISIRFRYDFAYKAKDQYAASLNIFIQIGSGCFWIQ